MPRQPHYCIVPGANNEPRQYPLKRWVRDNIEQLPYGFNPYGTSRQLRARLERVGWHMTITENEVFVVRPDAGGSFKYAEVLVQEIAENEDEELSDAEEDAYEVTFSLERDLQKALRQNIGFLERGLVITDGGRERNTAAGRIDITADDTEKRIVIIELKAIEAKPEVIAQVLAYMQAVQMEEGREVRGIIVASGFPERVRLAAKQIKHIKLVTYTFQFAFNTLS